VSGPNCLPSMATYHSGIRHPPVEDSTAVVCRPLSRRGRAGC
jgi:hypothetical protein